MLFYVILVIIIICIIAIYHYHPKTITINQTTIDKFNFNLLYQKSPIVITDSIINLNDILNIWFKYNFIYNGDSSNIWQQSKSKYVIIHNNNNVKTDVHICNPNVKISNKMPTSDSKIITIHLSENQFMILPFKWYYYLENNVTVLNIHDMYTIALSQIV